MSTNAPTGGSPAPAGVGDSLPPDIQKAFTQVVSGLATAYNLCHQMEPDSQACEALMELQRAVAEIQSHIGVSDAGAPAPDPAQQLADAMPPQGGGPFAQAAQDAHAQMLAGYGQGQ